MRIQTRRQIRALIDEKRGEIEDLEWELRSLERELENHAFQVQSFFCRAKLPGWFEPFTPEAFYRLEGLRELAHLKELAALDDDDDDDDRNQVILDQIEQSQARLTHLEDLWLKTLGATRETFVSKNPYPAAGPGFTGPKMGEVKNRAEGTPAEVTIQ